MSASVDVLAVLDQAIAREQQAGQACVAQVAARHAVAELIAAAKEVEKDAEILGMGCPRLNAALVLIGGAA